LILEIIGKLLQKSFKSRRAQEELPEIGDERGTRPRRDSVVKKKDAVKQRPKETTPSLSPSAAAVNKETEKSTPVNLNESVSSASVKPAKHYCKFWFDPHIRDRDPTFKVPDSTKLKIAAYNQYYRQYYAELIAYRRQRALRNEKLENELNNSNISETEKQKKRTEYATNESNYLRLRRSRMSIQEFTLLALLGRGGYGEVYLARKMDTGEIVALKRMKKSRFTNINQVIRIHNERVVMSKTNSPWLAQLKYSFTNERYVFLAMEYIPGGDIKALLDHVGCFSEENARFYFAEMLLAVDDLHSMGYVHRDLKPDNFLVDRTGHLKLIDFGLSKEGLSQKYAGTFLIANERRQSMELGKPWNAGNSNSLRSRANLIRTRKLAYSVVGSPEYMAVEILREQGYNHLCDYWSLGVILYELVYGITPFWSEKIVDVFANIMNYQANLKPPEDEDEDEIEVSRECWDLITRLIQEPERRIGSGLDGVNEVKRHPWFRGFNWDKIREMIPPFIPQLEDDLDTSYFGDSSLPESDEDIRLLLEENKLKENAVHLDTHRRSIKFQDKKAQQQFQQQLALIQSSENKKEFDSNFMWKGFTWKHFFWDKPESAAKETKNEKTENDSDKKMPAEKRQNEPQTTSQPNNNNNSPKKRAAKN
jgi:cell cycle protein kinase DBF2